MPQGSILGQLCFIIYISDMPTFDNMKIHKFIDDTTISQAASTKDSDKIHLALQSINTWSERNHMELNGRKTKEMFIDFRRKIFEPDPLLINGNLIECVEHFKILGVLVSKDLSWNEHVDRMISKCGQRL